MFSWISRLVSRRAPYVLIFAGVLLVLALVFGFSLFSRLDSEGFLANGSESAHVAEVLEDDFAHTTSDALILVSSKSGDEVQSTTMKSAVGDLVRQIDSVSGVSDVTDYYNTGASDLISRDGKETLLSVHFDKSTDKGTVANDLRGQISSSDLNVGFGGFTYLQKDVTNQVTEDLKHAEIVSFVILAILLVIVFRSVVAALIPLVLGGFTILVSILTLRLLAEFVPVNQYAVNIIAALGLGLSIDYSLLVVARFREEMMVMKKSVSEAIRETLKTAGHTVFFSGFTVIVCLLALAMFPLDMLRSMGIGGAITAFLAVIGGLFVLPAILRLLGPNINRLSFGKTRQGEFSRPTRFWHRLTDITGKRPLVFVVVVAFFLIISGSPIVGLKTVQINQDILPAGSETRQVLTKVDQDFDSGSSDLNIIYSRDFLLSDKSLNSLDDYVSRLEKIKGVESVSAITNLGASAMSKDQYMAILHNLDDAPENLRAGVNNLVRNDKTLIQIYTVEGFSANQADDLVRAVRSTATSGGARAEVGGMMAVNFDQLQAVGAIIPWAALWVIVAMVILMYLMVGSVVLPLQAIVMNTLSLSVALGAMVWVFEKGHLAGLLGFNADAGINITAPIIVFTIAFGLSMDYSVFLYGRIREEYTLLKDNKRAVSEGLAKTGGIITSAAVLLFVVVAAFATSKIAILQQIGFGLAVAVLVDAFLVRIILVPSIMALFGKANWWSPRFLQRFFKRFNLGE